jgi:hypothetical protein
MFPNIPFKLKENPKITLLTGNDRKIHAHPANRFQERRVTKSMNLTYPQIAATVK